MNRPVPKFPHTLGRYPSLSLDHLSVVDWPPCVPSSLHSNLSPYEIILTDPTRPQIQTVVLMRRDLPWLWPDLLLLDKSIPMVVVLVVVAVVVDLVGDIRLMIVSVVVLALLLCKSNLQERHLLSVVGIG